MRVSTGMSPPSDEDAPGSSVAVCSSDAVVSSHNKPPKAQLNKNTKTTKHKKQTKQKQQCPKSSTTAKSASSAKQASNETKNKKQKKKETNKLTTAALYTMGEDLHPLIELRVDYHESAPNQLRDLYTDYMDEDILWDSLLPSPEPPFGIVPTQWGETKRFVKRLSRAARRKWQGRRRPTP